MQTSQRVPHYLKPNARCRCPSNLIFLDTETIPVHETEKSIRHDLRCWCSIAYRLVNDKETRRMEACGQDSEQFWSFLVSRLDKSRPLWLFAHNAAFDMVTIGLGEVLESELFVTELSNDKLEQALGEGKIVNWSGLLVLDGPPTIIELVHKASGCKLIIVDTLNYWRCSLGELGNVIGIQKYDIPWNSTKLDDWIKYCQQDVATIAIAIRQYIRFVKQSDLGNFRYTTVSQGLQSYRHRFMQHRILVHCNEQSLRLERDGYFGGNCTIHQLGKVEGPVYVLDAQSFYPSICRDCQLPYCLVKHFDGPISPASIMFARHLYLIARVTVNTTKHVFPVKYRGLTVQALGRFQTVLHEPELLLALQSGSVETIHELSVYQRGYLFRKFVDEMWSKRLAAIESGDSVNANFFKLILNSPFGKLGQKQQQWLDCPHIMSNCGFGTWTHYCPDTKQREEYRCFGYRVQRRRRLSQPICDPATNWDFISVPSPAYNDESINSVPQIPGAITSYGRIRLKRYVDIAGMDNTFYTDTDCLHVNRQGFDALQNAGMVDSGKLGLLSIRGIYSQSEYRGIKYYRVDSEWVIAGVKETAIEMRPHVYRQYDFTGWNSLLCGVKNAHIHQTEVEIDRSNEAILGVVSESGRISPPVINMQ